jgi:hypothetical protein
MADPWLKFYTSDWRADPRLKMCSLASRGLWIEMICIMHEADPYGHLLVSGLTPTDTQLAVLTGASPDQIAALLGELESAGVFSRTRAGVIYSRKMSRMAKKAATARNNGRKGGNPSLSKERQNQPSDKGGDNPSLKGRDKTQKPEARVKEKEDTNVSSKKKGSRLSPDWQLPKDWGLWAIDQGMDELSVRREADRFRDYWIGVAGARGVKLDWLATWRNWVRKASEQNAEKKQTPQHGEVKMKDGQRFVYRATDGWVREYV